MILVTLVGQGLTLPLLIRRLGLDRLPDDDEQEEVVARLVAATAALDRLDTLSGEDWTNDDTIGRVRGQYEFRRRRFKVRAGRVDEESRLDS